MEQGDVFGEECMANQPLRMFTASVSHNASLIRFDKKALALIVHEDPEFSELFTACLISHNIRLQENLMDQFFNSSKKRLARILLLLSHYDHKSNPEPVIPLVSQEALAAMVGTTRSRVSHFMNGFKRNGFIDYDLSSNVLRIHSKLQQVVS
jgi:CRP-like cAMP-binding protein